MQKRLKVLEKLMVSNGDQNLVKLIHKSLFLNESQTLPKDGSRHVDKALVLYENTSFVFDNGLVLSFMYAPPSLHSQKQIRHIF